jgi:hypothetical protein
MLSAVQWFDGSPVGTNATYKSVTNDVTKALTCWRAVT